MWFDYNYLDIYYGSIKCNGTRDVANMDRISICPSCGSQNVTGQRFCGSCGAGLYQPTQQQTESQSENKEKLVSICVRLVEEGKYEDALRYAEMYIGIDPEDDRGWGLKGLCLVKLNREEEAFTCCQKALEINPQRIRTRDILSGIYYHIGDYKSLASLAHETLQFAPKNIKACVFLAEALMHMNELREAETELLKALESLYQAQFAESEDLAIVRQELGILYVMRGQSEKAMAEFEEAIKADQQDQWCYQLADACLILNITGVLMKGNPEEKRARLLGYAQQRGKTYTSYMQWKAENQV